MVHSDACASVIEGIGRPCVEPSFLPQLVDRMEAVRDAHSIAAARVVSRRLGRRVGGSTGTNIWACAMLAHEMAEAGEKGAIVSILCDAGERYADTLYNDDWLATRGLDTRAAEARMERFFDSGDFG